MRFSYLFTFSIVSKVVGVENIQLFKIESTIMYHFEDHLVQLLISNMF